VAFIDKTVETAADIRDVYAAWTAFEDYPTCSFAHRMHG
jgi:hypothetical protein